MRELEDENARLRAENDDLRRRLASDDGEISASTSVYGYDDRAGASPRRSNSFYSVRAIFF
jgi:regulator of replication initiation timing